MSRQYTLYTKWHKGICRELCSKDHKIHEKWYGKSQIYLNNILLSGKEKGKSVNKS